MLTSDKECRLFDFSPDQYEEVTTAIEQQQNLFVINGLPSCKFDENHCKTVRI